MSDRTKCPIHAVPMPATHTKYGMRRACPVPGCTVVGWDGPTSTPADAETRDLRHQCHLAFDPLWRDHTRFHNRGSAYRWLKMTMGVLTEHAHIGMFDKAQCEKFLAAIRGLKIK